MEKLCIQDKETRGFGTISAIGAEVDCCNINPLSPPIYSSSTFKLESSNHGAILCESKEVDPEMSPYLYSRWKNPTVDACCRAVSSLESPGSHSFVLSSGMAAITTTFLSFLSAGDHVICPKAVYGGTHEFLDSIAPRFGILVSFVDSTDVSNYESAFRKETKLIYAETPANPTMSLLDLEAFGALGKKLGVISVVDSTFASPFNQRPLSYSIDIVIHSATKYLGGHSDLVAGTITCSSLLHSKIFPLVKLLGNFLPSFEAFLLLRGMKTLAVRVMCHNANALQVAEYLQQHPKVTKVHYPFLKEHPQYQLALKQMKGGGGMVSFEVIGGIEAGKRLIENVKLITLAVSLGSVESLIEHAASMTHTMIEKSVREAAGITDGLIRLSVGIEDVEDIIADLSQALEKLS